MAMTFPSLVLGDKLGSSVNAARTPPNCCTISWTRYNLHCQRHHPMRWVSLVKRNRRSAKHCQHFVFASWSTHMWASSPSMTVRCCDAFLITIDSIFWTVSQNEPSILWVASCQVIVPEMKTIINITIFSAQYYFNIVSSPMKLEREV